MWPCRVFAAARTLLSLWQMEAALWLRCVGVSLQRFLVLEERGL